MLEAEGRPLGIVTAINGATRLVAVVTGSAGHAGASPMDLQARRARRRRRNGAGDRSARAGRAPNSSPPSAGSRSSPARSMSSPAGCASRSTCARRSTSAAAAPSPTSPRRWQAIAARRGVRLELTPTHEAAGYVCHPTIVAGLEAAVVAVGAEPRLLPSGAGHDTMVMGQRWPAGMLFVRCKGGVSHNPAESISEDDCAHRARRADAFRRGLPAVVIDGVKARVKFRQVLSRDVKPGA